MALLDVQVAVWMSLIRVFEDEALGPHFLIRPQLPSRAQGDEIGTRLAALAHGRY